MVQGKLKRNVRCRGRAGDDESGKEVWLGRGYIVHPVDLVMIPGTVPGAEWVELRKAVKQRKARVDMFAELTAGGTAAGLGHGRQAKQWRSMEGMTASASKKVMALNKL